MRIIALIVLLAVAATAGKYDKVKITPDMAYIYVYHKGKAVKVHRIQDTKHKLTGEYAKIYRPGKSIQPIKMHKDIQTIGEVELLQFMVDKGNKKKGLVVDLRSKKAYKKESIPSAVNIPAETKDNKTKVEKILKILGAKRAADGSLDTSRAMEVAFYCNGLWCNKSSEFIKTFLELGYPADKMLYYRGGFQMWKILGFTTVANH
ncbi:MAG TPA: rhodanese-like domain-containing protein [Sulfurovum sp.]|nr:rhodanese-like domain-containing protein [Sulfurovum sp.]